MKLNFLLILVFIFKMQICIGQDVNWKNAQNWKLYNIHDRAGFRYSVDTLQNFKSIELNIKLMSAIMNNIVEWPKEKYSMWMGLYIATCEMGDKKLRKVIISSYGGFFFDELTKRYFEISPELNNQWYELLNESSKKMIAD